MNYIKKISNKNGSNWGVFKDSDNNAILWMFIQSVIAISTFIWLIVVIRVFIIQDRISYLALIDTIEHAKDMQQLDMLSSNKVSAFDNNLDLDVSKLRRQFIPKALNSSIDFSNHDLNAETITSSSWKFIRSNQNYLISGPETVKIFQDYENNKEDKSYEYKGTIIDATELTWPPVDEDGIIPDSDGADFMPLTKLKVPRFWKAPEGTDINKIGTFVNGHETIYLMIASYRDFQCHETIANAFARAEHPERLFVGAVDQVVPDDVECFTVDKPCVEDPEQTLCKYQNQIAVFTEDAQFATGPVTARHIGDRMYRGQYFVMQLDAHCLFVNNWDTLLIDQWKQTGNEMAVLSSYLTDVQGSVDSKGDSLRNTRPIMCSSDFEGEMPARYLRHLTQPETVAVIRDMPQLEPFWAAGFSFSRGHFKYQVPYDGYQPMVFQGEEIAIGIRGFTYGYDFYAFRDSVVFHEYADHSSRRKKIHMFWENSQQHAGEGKKSLRRATAVIGMAPDLDPTSWDHTEIEKYSLGNVRPLSLFYKTFLIDPVNRKAIRLCSFVETGFMHQHFQPFLRPDGLGIDYTKLEDFDTLKAMEKK